MGVYFPQVFHIYEFLLLGGLEGTGQKIMIRWTYIPTAIHMFEWSIIIEHKIVLESHTWYFPEDEATFKAPTTEISRGFKILNDELLIPDAFSLLSQCYSHLFDQNAVKMVATACLGCSVNHPSQKHHLEGYLISPEDAGEMYGDEIVVEQSTIDLYGKIRTVLLLPSATDVSNINMEDRSALYPHLEKMRGDSVPMHNIPSPISQLMQRLTME